jgi:rhodanese-related sulfurtransferase
MMKPDDDAAGIVQLSAPELKQMIESGQTFEFVDVRTDDERAVAAIDGSRLLDRAYHDHLLSLTARCRSSFSATTASAARRRRFPDPRIPSSLHLRGGIDAWSVLVDPSVPRY